MKTNEIDATSPASSSVVDIARHLREKVAHTPGPWIVNPAFGSASFTDVACADGTRQGRLAASVFHSGETKRPMIRVGAPNDDIREVMANTHLVGAAPELLDALIRIVDPAPGVKKPEPWVYGIAIPAIAKALGLPALERAGGAE